MSDVKNRVYPGKEHTVFMAPEELDKFKKMVGWTK
jgi:3-methyl-2-oxobutanoate hydroxymethyltransferase